MDMPPSAPNTEPWKPQISHTYVKPEKRKRDDEFDLSVNFTTEGGGVPPELGDTMEQDSIPIGNYITKDGNFRYYHNPKSGQETKIGDVKVDYSLGATKCPYLDLEEIKEKTVTPISLGETDFFTNYINAGLPTDTVITDEVTGNRYYNFREYNPAISGVGYEGEKHFNIQRFLIDPHYRFFKIKKDEARVNTLHDIYRYFLYQEKGDREKAWEEANKFMIENVDPLIESKYAEWANENYQALNIMDFSDPEYFIGSFNVYDIQGRTTLPDHILQYNRRIFGKGYEGRPFSRIELVDALTDYNINFRKKSPGEAKRIAEESVNNAEERYRKLEEEVRNRPLSDFQVIREPEFPVGFENWGPGEQDEWKNNNTEKLGEFVYSFTEEDRERELRDLRNFRFADE